MIHRNRTRMPVLQRAGITGSVHALAYANHLNRTPIDPRLCTERDADEQHRSEVREAVWIERSSVRLCSHHQKYLTLSLTSLTSLPLGDPHPTGRLPTHAQCRMRRRSGFAGAFLCKTRPPPLSSSATPRLYHSIQATVRSHARPSLVVALLR